MVMGIPVLYPGGDYDAVLAERGGCLFSAAETVLRFLTGRGRTIQREVPIVTWPEKRSWLPTGIIFLTGIHGNARLEIVC